MLNKITLPNYYKITLYTDDNNKVTTDDDRNIIETDFGPYISFEILNTKDGQFKLRSKEINDSYNYLKFSDDGNLVVNSTFKDASNFEIHVNDHCDNDFDKFTLYSFSINNFKKNNGRKVYVSFLPPFNKFSFLFALVEQTNLKY